jgi:hypothetical protein
MGETKILGFLTSAIPWYNTRGIIPFFCSFIVVVVLWHLGYYSRFLGPLLHYTAGVELFPAVSDFSQHSHTGLLRAGTPQLSEGVQDIGYGTLLPSFFNFFYAQPYCPSVHTRTNLKYKTGNAYRLLYVYCMYILHDKSRNGVWIRHNFREGVPSVM